MTTTSYACPVCGTVHDHQSERYKNHVCRECEERARCVAHDRIVHGYDTSPLAGGFVAFHTEFRMREAYMGGIVVHPLDPT